MSSVYSKTYNSFSGTDIVASITVPGGKPIVFGELQTISYSIHREKFPVRTLGRINPKGFSYGPRTIAGSMIFTVFDRYILKEAVNETLAVPNQIYTFQSPFSDYQKKLQAAEMYHRMLADEMPLFDVTLSFMNEYGQASVMHIHDITIVDEGQVMSIEDMMTENTMSYTALDITPMTPVNLKYGNDNGNLSVTGYTIDYPKIK